MLNLVDMQNFFSRVIIHIHDNFRIPADEFVVGRQLDRRGYFRSPLNSRSEHDSNMRLLGEETKT